jgi:putative FmdB family regulatory protein
MPIYEFKCRDCNRITEETMSIVQGLENYICPKCGGVTDKLMPHTNFNLSPWKEKQEAAIKEAMTPAYPEDVIDD